MHKKMTLRQNHVRTGLIIGASFLAMGALSGCQSAISSLPLIHKQDILQGNVLDKDELSQVREGMTKRQILLLLGSPSVSDPFHQDRWDYVYTLAPRGGDLTQRILTLRFEGEKLLSIDGDYLDIIELAQEEAKEIEEEQRRIEEEEG
jgi:outer membrane protein assembly factor BamE